jgi:uncharacterized protein (DUF924 family)
VTIHLGPQQVLRFWFGEGAQRGSRQRRWFEKSAEFDGEVRARFLRLYEQLAAAPQTWLGDAEQCLARIVVLDQFPRNMFRGTPRAFAADGLAREAARHALARSYDRGMKPVERMFCYLPLEHSEAMEDQELACALTEPLAAFAETSDAHAYALKHRDVIRRFARFPHRNAILGRTSTPEETEFLKQPGSSF